MEYRTGKLPKNITLYSSDFKDEEIWEAVLDALDVPITSDKNNPEAVCITVSAIDAY